MVVGGEGAGFDIVVESFDDVAGCGRVFKIARFAAVYLVL